MEGSKMKNTLIILLSCVIFAGCNTTSDDRVAKSDGYKCEQVKTLGSSIPKRICSTKSQRDEQRELSKESMRDAQRSGNLSGSGQG